MFSGGLLTCVLSELWGIQKDFLNVPSPLFNFHKPYMPVCLCLREYFSMVLPLPAPHSHCKSQARCLLCLLSQHPCLCLHWQTNFDFYLQLILGRVFFFIPQGQQMFYGVSTESQASEFSFSPLSVVDDFAFASLKQYIFAYVDISLPKEDRLFSTPCSYTLQELEVVDSSERREKDSGKLTQLYVFPRHCQSSPAFLTLHDTCPHSSATMPSNFLLAPLHK